MKVSKAVFYLVAIFSLAIIAADARLHFGFYFTGSLTDYKKWFPNFYLPVFLFFKFMLPLLYGLWVFNILTLLERSKFEIYFILTGQTMFLLYILTCLSNGFDIVIVYPYGLLFLTVFLRVYNLLKKLVKRYIFPYLVNYMYFIFVIYICLSWLFNEFQPFSKYPMYSALGKKSYVFLLRDSKGRMIPLHNFFFVTGNGLGHLYFSLCNAQHLDAMGNDLNGIKAVIGKEMFEYLSANRKAYLPEDTASLNRICFYFDKGEMKNDEVQLYKGKIN